MSRESSSGFGSRRKELPVVMELLELTDFGVDEITMVFGVVLVTEECVDGCKSSCMVVAVPHPVHVRDHPLVSGVGRRRA